MILSVIKALHDKLMQAVLPVLLSTKDKLANQIATLQLIVEKKCLENTHGIQ